MIPSFKVLTTKPLSDRNDREFDRQDANRIGIRGSAFQPFRTRTFKTHYIPFMEKSQQRAIIYYFSLKGRVA
jgi:hypothetical protein